MRPLSTRFPFAVVDPHRAERDLDALAEVQRHHLGCRRRGARRCAALCPGPWRARTAGDANPIRTPNATRAAATNCRMLRALTPQAYPALVLLARRALIATPPASERHHYSSDRQEPERRRRRSSWTPRSPLLRRRRGGRSVARREGQDGRRMLGLLATRRRLVDPANDLAVVVGLQRLELQRVHVVGQRPDRQLELLELAGRDLPAGPRDLGDDLARLCRRIGPSGQRLHGHGLQLPLRQAG